MAAKKRVGKKTAKKAVKKAAKKKAGTKKAAARKPARKAVVAKKKAAPAAATAAAVPCVPASQAFGLVMGCAGQTFDVDTKLKDAFPSDERRLQFCQCVASQSGVPVTQVSCAPGNSFGDVMDSISC